jgi:protein ImuB
MAALPYPALPAGALPTETPATRYRQASALWLGVQILDPLPDATALQSLAAFAQSLTPIVVVRPDEGLLLEVHGSLKYFSGLSAIKDRLTAELEQRRWAYRLATAPTPLAACWFVRCRNAAVADITDRGALAGAIGQLPLAATAWPDKVQLMLRQMGVRSIGDCLRLPRAGFARRIGQARLEDLDRALGRKPDFHNAWRAPQKLFRAVDFTLEMMDQAIFADAIGGIAVVFERELRQRQMQVKEVELKFRHLRCEDTVTRIHFVDPVHESERLLNPLLARIERMLLSEPAVAPSLETGALLPLAAESPGLLPLLEASAGSARSVPEYALVECLRGRFGTRSVYGIDWVAEHRPERAWRSWIDRPASAKQTAAAGPRHSRPLWLLPKPQKNRRQKNWGQTPFLNAARAPASKMGSDPNSKMGSDPNFSANFSVERIESGWWDGRDIRRDYCIVVGAAGEKLWFYRDCVTGEWYLHGIFG